MTSYEKDKEKLLKRLKRIEGQVRGIQKMIEEDKYCVDILTQVSSVTAATRNVGMLVLKDHINGCVRNSLSAKDNEEIIEEMVTSLNRFIKS